MTNLYYNEVIAGLDCRINVEFNPMAAVRGEGFFHKITGEVNGVIYIDEQPVKNGELAGQIQRLRGDLSQIAQIVYNPESHGTVKTLRSMGFDFAEGSGPVKLNAPTRPDQTGNGMIDEY